MKKVGLKYPVYAIYSDATGVPVYTNGRVMAKAMKVGLKWDKNNEKCYADDGVDDIDQSIAGGTENLAVNELTQEVQSELLGHGFVGGELVIHENDVAPYVGHGFYGKVKRNGEWKFRAVWLTKMQFSEPDDETETEKEKKVFQTPTIDGVIMKDINGNLKREKLFDTEAEAINYLNAKIGLPTSASAGISALVVTGAGGALSPTFVASNRLYAFTGITATSLTVNVTAALHTIKLYVDGVLSQNLSSGIVSAAITVAIGTKKITIVAQETGKSPQTTEITVVKTV